MRWRGIIERLPLRRLSGSVLFGFLAQPSPAFGDPITVAIFGAAFAASIGGAIVTAVITFALTTLVSLAVNALFGPKNKEQDRQASVVQLSIGESARECLLGEVGTGGSLADAFNYGGEYGTDWEVQIVVVADHRCHSLTGFYVGDAYVAFTGDGPVAGYNGQLEVYWREGTEDQVMPAIVTTYGGWGADDNLAGCAVIVAAYKADDPQSQSPIWTAGRPTFLWVVKGKYIYSPRKDSTVPGGFGTHRWDDPATWEWSNNLIDCRYNWQRGVYACDRIDQPGMLLVGRGLSSVEAPPERTIASANLCDETVALKAGGSEPRYLCNLVVKADEDFITTEESFAAACAGVIVQREGGVEIEPGAARSVVAELTDADFIVGESFTFNRFKTDTQRFNTIVPRYIAPDQRWADHAAPIRRDLTDLVEDGGPREDTLTLTAVTSNTQAQRCGEIRRRLARRERTATGTLGPRYAHLEDGDWVGFTSVKRLQGARVVFRINSYSLPANWRNTVVIEEITASCFDWDAETDEVIPGAVAEQQAVPVIGAPRAYDWDLEGETLSSDGGSIPAIVITGAAPVAYVEQIVFEYRAHGDTEWIGTELAAPATTRREIASVRPGISYDAAISYVVRGVVTPRLVLGPVTAGELAQPTAVALAIRSAYFSVASGPLTASDVSGDGHVVIADQVWDYPTLGTEVTRTGATLTGLTLGTRYYVYFDDATLTDTTPAYATSTVYMDALNSTTHPSRHYLGAIDIPASGAPPVTGGGGGGGYGCPVPETPVELADHSEKPAGELVVGDMVWANHEITLRWGAYPVTHVDAIDCDMVYEATIYGRTLRASGTHLVWRDGAWRAFASFAKPIGPGRVMRITVGEAHTYVAAGVLSHNKRAKPEEP